MENPQNSQNKSNNDSSKEDSSISRIIEEKFESLSFGFGNPLYSQIPNLSNDSIKDILKAANDADKLSLEIFKIQNDSKDNESKRNYQYKFFLTIIIATIFLSITFAFLYLKPDLITHWFTLVTGLAGGFGIGKIKTNKIVKESE